MSPENETPRLTGSRKHFQVHVGGLPGTLLGFVAGAVGLVLALMFSLVLFAVLLGAGVVFGGYLWWKTRKVRQVLREEHARRRTAGEREVEGEVVHVDPLDGKG